MTSENIEPTSQMPVPPDLYDYVAQRSLEYQLEQRKKRLLKGACAATTLVAAFAIGVWYPESGEAVPQEALPAIETTVAMTPPTTGLAITTTVEASTTTSTTIARLCMTPTMEILPGESLFGIAALCNVALSDLLAFNPEIVNPDDVAAGYQVRTAPPETMTTTIPAETATPSIAPEIAPAETVATETVLADTAPIPVEETVPPASPETTVPAPPTNDGVLSEAECIAAGGKKYSFSVRETLMQYFKNHLGLSETLAFRATKKPRVEELRLRQIYADDPSDDVDLRECVPLTTDGLL